MTSSTFTKRSFFVARLGLTVVALGTIAIVIGIGCLPPDFGGGSEGDRCNPSLSHDECGSGLACTQPALCPENYCCPTSGTSTNPFCQTGCNGGAAAICTADMDPDACAFVNGPPEAAPAEAAPAEAAPAEAGSD